MSTTSEQILAKVMEYNAKERKKYYRRDENFARNIFNQNSEQKFENFVKENCTPTILKQAGTIEENINEKQETIALVTPFGRLIKEKIKTSFITCETYTGFVDYKHNNGLTQKVFVYLERHIPKFIDIDGFIREEDGNIIALYDDELTKNDYREILPQTIAYFNETKAEINMQNTQRGMDTPTLS